MCLKSLPFDVLVKTLCINAILFKKKETEAAVVSGVDNSSSAPALTALNIINVKLKKCIYIFYFIFIKKKNIYIYTVPCENIHTLNFFHVLLCCCLVKLL